MEMQSPVQSESAHPEETLQSKKNQYEEFAPGTEVVYALHGRCNLTAIEIKKIEGEEVRFYRLEIQKASLARSTRQDPTIWLPVASAKHLGLRYPMNLSELEQVLLILGNREYYFNPNEYWHSLYPKLEECIRKEGSRGLAKVESFLFVLKQQHVVVPAEITRFSETIHRLLFRELSIALNEPIKTLEERLQKGMRHKLVSNS